MSVRPRKSRRLGLAAGPLLGVLCVTACASHRPMTTADRFIRPADPDAEVVELLPRDESSLAEAGPLFPDLPDGHLVGQPVPKTSSGLTLEGADAGLADALAAHRAAPTVASMLAVAREYARLRIWDRADDYLLLALNAAPKNAAAWAARARVWRDWGLPELAMGHAARAVYFAPGSADALNTMGTVLTMTGQFDEARARFEAALAADPGGAYILNNLCYLEIAAGRPDHARARCEAALALDPALEAARQNLARIPKKRPSE